MKYTKRKEFVLSLEAKLAWLQEEQARLMEVIAQGFTVETFRELNMINNSIIVTEGREDTNWRKVIVPICIKGLPTEF